MYASYQSKEDASQLYDVGVGDWVKSSDPGVADGDQRREDHCHVQVHVDDHSQGGAWKKTDGGILL